MGKPEFFNDNACRNHPFVPGTVGLAAASGLYGLPDDAVVDCGFVVGPESEYADGTDSVYLTSVSRSGAVVTFTFASSAAALYGEPLVFTRTLGGPDYETEFVESGAPARGGDRPSASAGASDCDPAAWSGFLVTGPMVDLAAWLADGQTVVGDGVAATVEPALVQNLAGSFVTSLAVANEDRTRATAPAGCPEIVWPFVPGSVFVWGRCVRGDVRFAPGYNALVSEDVAANAVVLGARPGAGAGKNCADVPVFPGETSAGPYSGAQACSGILRSVNGLGGPDVPLVAGSGVSITPDPARNRVLVNVNMADLSTCFRAYSRVSDSISEAPA